LVEANALTLAKETEHRAFEAPGLEEDLSAVVVPHDDANTGGTVVDLDDTLH
jgi:hypothetical protein